MRKKTTFFALCMVMVGFVSAFALCVKALFSPQAVAAVESAICIVVDAGHGGIDGGVSGRLTGVKESDINLAIAQYLCEELQEFGFDVVMTRKTAAGLYDVATKGFKKRDMQRRKEIIESANPDLVLSIHQNFYPTKSTRGGQVFYRKENEQSQRLAEGVQGKLNDLYEGVGVKKRKSMPAEYFILQCAPCPSVIVECGFLSNAEDEKLLCDSIWQRKLAQRIAAGALAYFAEGMA